MLNRNQTEYEIVKSFYSWIKKSVAILFVTLSIFLLSSKSVFAQEKASDKAATPGNTAVTGEVVDMDCYMSHEAHGDDHKKCATTCISGGGPMGILTKDGKVYLVVKDDDKPDAYEALKKHAAETVTVMGEIYNRGGIASVEIESVK